MLDSFYHMTLRLLWKTRFREHFCKMKKPKKIDKFLNRHFKSNGHSPIKNVIQPVEKLYMIQIHQLD